MWSRSNRKNNIKSTFLMQWKFTSHGGNIYVDMEVNDRCNKLLLRFPMMEKR